MHIYQIDMVKDMNLSYDNYRIFYYVAKYQGFTHAALVLGNSQPNITRTIKNLEQALGCKLFVRSNHGVQLTPEGEKLYAHVSLAFQHIQAGEAELVANQSLESGVVTIAASEIALHYCLLPILKVYRTMYPGVRIRVFNNSSPQAVEVLKNGLADFAVVTASHDFPKTVHCHRIMDAQEIPIAGSPFSFLREKSLTLKELACYPLVGLAPNTSTFDFYSQLFGTQGLIFQPDVEVATVDQILPMIKNGLGIGFAPMAFAQDDILSGNVFVLQLNETIPARPIYFLKQTDQLLSLAAKELETMIVNKS